MTITGGEWSIRTGDDGIHADAAVLIQAGNFTIPYCYEGMEGQSVTIDSGTLDITARDDGLNAAGGADGSGTAYGFGRQEALWRGKSRRRRDAAGPRSAKASAGRYRVKL